MCFKFPPSCSHPMVPPVGVEFVKGRRFDPAAIVFRALSGKHRLFRPLFVSDRSRVGLRRHMSSVGVCNCCESRSSDQSCTIAEIVAVGRVGAGILGTPTSHAIFIGPFRPCVAQKIPTHAQTPCTGRCTVHERSVAFTSRRLERPRDRLILCEYFKDCKR